MGIVFRPTDQRRGRLLLLTLFILFVFATSGIAKAAAMNTGVSAMEIPSKSGVKRRGPLPNMATMQGTKSSKKSSRRGCRYTCKADTSCCGYDQPIGNGHGCCTYETCRWLR